MLAWDPIRAESAISSGLHRWTPYTITDPEEIREELATIRKDGIAHDRQEIALGLSCIAAPIFGRNNEPIAAMSVSGASSQFKPEEHILALKRICAAAGRAALEHQRNLERTA